MLDEETEAKVDELVDEFYAALVDDRDLRFWEGGIVQVAPTGAPPEYLTVEIEGIDDESVMWRGVPASLAVGDEVLCWENPITHRREIIGGSGAGGTSTSSPWQKVTVAVSGGDFALLSAAIAWINALPGPVAPSATRRFAINVLGGTFVEPVGFNIPSYVHVDGEGEGTVIDMSGGEIFMVEHSSLENMVVTSTGADSGMVIDVGFDVGAPPILVVLRDLRVILTGAGLACIWGWTRTGLEAYHVICEATTGGKLGFYFDDCDVLLWGCKADDATNFDGPLYLDSTAAGTTTTKFCEFRGAVDDVFVSGNDTWEHIACNVDAQRVTLTGTSTPLPITPINLDGWPDALILDADGDTTISAPSDDQIDFEVGGADILRLTATALHSQGSVFPDLGTTTLAEKLGDVYLGTAKDVFAWDDGGGLFTRSPNHWFTPTTHFNAFPGTLAWAGAPFAGAPAAADIATFPSILRVYGNNAANRYFAQQAVGGVTLAVARLTIRPSTYAGLRFDDGTDNNYVELSLVAGTVAGFLRIRARTMVGGVGPTDVFYADGLPAAFYVLQLIRTGGAAFFDYTEDGPATLSLGANADVWASSRVGLVFENTANLFAVAFYDWLRLA